MKISNPNNGWGLREGAVVVPRKWQESALVALINHYQKPNPSRAVVFAATGSGKALLISQFCACIECDSNEVVVVSTPRQKLVRQLRKTIEDRLESDEFMSPKNVGAYFSDTKDGLDDRRVIVTCNDSMKNLAEALSIQGKSCAVWLADELHTTENNSMKTAYEALLPRMALGFSATPYLSNVKKGISSFDEVIVKFSIQQALEDGVVVPWKVVGWENGETDLDTACIELMRAQGGRGIVNAVSIADAEQFSKRASDEGYAVRAVHSQQSDKENDEIIAEMISGEINAICHVDLLTAGSDIPELLFICMRRVVGSRNRFVQELGRGIRSYTDPETGEKKTHLTILDPHDLMSVHRLHHQACLSGDFDPDEIAMDEEPESKKLERSLQQQCFSTMRHLCAVKNGKEPLSLEPLATYLSQLCSVFDTFNLLEKPISSRDWRRASASEKQIKTMQNLKWSLGRKQVPSIHRNALEILTTVGQMNRGMASDLISIEMSLAEKSTWPKFSQLDQCVKDGLERHAKKKLNPNKPRAVLAPPGVVGPKLEQGLLFEGVAKK